jgi:hypothetical protein
MFPTVPPIEPAWANAGASTSRGASTPSDPTTASILDNFPISVTKSQPMDLSSCTPKSYAPGTRHDNKVAVSKVGFNCKLR